MSTANISNPPNEKAEKALVQFKAMLQECGRYDPAQNSDYQLYRFLRARKYDLQKSADMFIKYLDWHKTEKVDEIVKNFKFDEHNQVFEIYPQFYHKTDKEGRTIYIEQLKNFDINKLLAVTTQERIMLRHIREYEKFTKYRLAACSAKMGKNIESGFTIVDLKGVPLSQFNQVRKMLGTLSSIASDYYPETLGKMFIINAPVLFSAIWSVIKAMLDEHTASKINILGSNYQKDLLKYIEPENLPAFLGGTCNCPGGCEKSDLGPWNDGSTAGFPNPVWEDFKLRDQKYAFY